MSRKMDQFLRICRKFKPSRITIETKEHGNLKDVMMLVGPDLSIQITNYAHDRNFSINLADGEEMEINISSSGGIITLKENSYPAEPNHKHIEALFHMKKGVFSISIYGSYQQDERKPDIIFEDLMNRAVSCSVCPRMKEKKAVISKFNGNIQSDLMFITEAPGPNGAELSRIPMSGDSSGKNFEELLGHIGLTRDEVYLTHAVLCCPTDKYEKVRVPSAKEITNCSHFLMEQIELVQPKVIVTMGSNALKALNTIKKHSIVLKEHVAQPQEWNSYKVFPLYHTSTVVMNRRKRTKEQQIEDFIMLRDYYLEGTEGQVPCPENPQD
ncbi:uracil-DNA glycosylase [Rossellomorea sp. NS-SX7]|uniref:uracil-DNA glycosylase n=1 Tax=Rossellomorea sp. NS-SX7 TaxID=3463856 RepID=UPI004059EA7A